MRSDGQIFLMGSAFSIAELAVLPWFPVPPGRGTADIEEVAGRLPLRKGPRVDERPGAFLSVCFALLSF